MNTRPFFALSIVLLLFFSPEKVAAQWNSEIVELDTNGALTYIRDAEGNVIPDFSYAGYMGGGVEIPTVLTEFNVSPIPGDNTAHIQAFIDQAAQLPADALGLRGAILLEAGRYEIHGTLRLNQSGVVLRGVGDEADTLTNTVLIGVGNTPNQRDILVAGGGAETAWSGQVSGTKTDVISELVRVGEHQIKVANPAPYAVGDNIVLYHPCTQAWLDAIDGGGTDSEPNWNPGDQPLVFNRRIVEIQDSVITVDVPFYNHLDRSLAQSYIYRYNRSGLRTQIGVENLRIDIQTAGGTDENHAWNAISLTQVEDAWVRNCTVLHFGLSGVETGTATRVTIENCRALDPVAQVTGARMYNFNLLKASSQVLVRNCHANNGRHHYVSNGTSWVSGCVFLRSTSEAAYTSSEGHRRWSMALLYDNHEEVSVRSNGLRLLALYNRGDYGTSHGWSAAHSVAWNCDVKNGQLLVQKPPTAQNYAIGCAGTVNGNGPFSKPVGYIEGTNVADLMPESLYEAQLYARLNGLEPIFITTGTDLRTETLQLNLFPNPARSSVQIELEVASPLPVQLQLYDIAGRLLLRDEFSKKTELDLNGLETGLYLLRLKQGNRQAVRRLLKE